MDGFLKLTPRYKGQLATRCMTDSYHRKEDSCFHPGRQLATSTGRRNRFGLALVGGRIQVAVPGTVGRWLISPRMVQGGKVG
ncbi:hypothetical protein GCM10011383_45490 [Hymenobacter cavernae]|uniref:Uncharacterized protein n=1 Tax=Hymenobacter cavernae TaxID=2044852 RepID=A0ABQ1UW99_9BACT|nr:hypothetical protein GCM10011383_45490 [Hymenobacter cavernae]